MSVKSDQLEQEHSEEAYITVGSAMNFDILGVCASEADFTKLLEDPGTIAEKRWLTVKWDMPDKEMTKCWWLANAKDTPTAKPNFFCRSLAALRLELHATRIATSGKLRKTFEKRSEDNSKAVDILHTHQHLWK